MNADQAQKIAAPSANTTLTIDRNHIASVVKPAGTEVSFTSKVVSRVPSEVGIYKNHELSLKGWL